MPEGDYRSTRFSIEVVRMGSKNSARTRHIPVQRFKEIRPYIKCNLMQIAIRLSPELFAKLKNEAIKRELSMSSVIVERLGDKIS